MHIPANITLEMLRWRHAVSVIPSIKYFYAYSHHCTSFTPQLNSSLKHCSHTSCTSVQSHLWKDEIAKQVEAKSKRSSAASCHRRPQNLINEQCLAHFLSLKNYEHNKPQAAVMNKNLPMKQVYPGTTLHNYNKLSLVESIFFDDSKVVNNMHMSCSTKVKKFEFSFHDEPAISRKEPDKEPADEPKVKIRVLSEKIRNEAPMLLKRITPYHDFTVYTKNVELYVTMKKVKFSTSGIRKYRFAVSLFRRLQLWYLSKPELEILSINTNEEQHTIEVRWRVSGWTPLAVFTTCVLRMTSNQSCFDFNSIFYVNDDGNIWRHDFTKLKQISERVPLRDRVQELRQRAVGAVAAMSSHIVSPSSNFNRTKFNLYKTRH